MAILTNHADRLGREGQTLQEGLDIFRAAGIHNYLAGDEAGERRGDNLWAAFLNVSALRRGKGGRGEGGGAKLRVRIWVGVAGDGDYGGGLVGWVGYEQEYRD